jgi:dipeptidyl aminopeptidase/acylaminoacyl peptidase
MRLILVAGLILVGAYASLSQTRRVMTAADILRVATVGDAQMSPDGVWVVYTVATPEGDGTRSMLWLVRTASDTSQTALEAARPAARRSAPVPLLQGGWNASSPRWSPDSRRIAFLSSEKDETAIYVISLDNRSPRRVATVSGTNFFITYAGEQLAWSPDGRRLAYISATETDAAQESRAQGNDPRVIDRLQYKSRTSFSDKARTHLFVIDVDDNRAEPRQLTEGRFYDHALTWSPRGDEIAFLSNHETDPDANNNSDIYAVSLNGRVRQITDTPGCEYEPQWSPDGKWLAYTATRREVTTIDSVAEDAHVWVIDAQGGRGRELNARQDRRARSPRWSPDNRTILFLANNQGKTLLYQIGLNGGEARPLFERLVEPTSRAEELFDTFSRPFQISSFSFAPFAVSETPTGINSYILNVAFALSDATHPAEIWLARTSTRPRVPGSVIALVGQAVSQHNAAFTNSTILVDLEEINFRSFDGTPVQGWLMKPAGWREGSRYPLILSIHGGPHGMYGYGFNSTFQAYAARGYAVLYLNPRGSSGYGQKFSDGTLREWGGGDYRDLLAGVDEALRRFTWIDSERMGVTGGSYGGFMTNWIITQTPRFKAAVAHASVSNLISFYATSLYQDLIHGEFGLPWDDYDLLWRWSPLRYARQAQTPTLFIHGEQDNDVHITQAEEMYMALKRRGVETELVRYPREGHSFHEPRHRVDALERTLVWFDKYVK